MSLMANPAGTAHEFALMLALSTAHMSPRTAADWMPQCPWACFAKGEWGWFMYVCDDVSITEAEDIPLERYAPLSMLPASCIANGIMWDCDGPIVADLPEYDWTNSKRANVRDRRPELHPAHATSSTFRAHQVVPRYGIGGPIPPRCSSSLPPRARPRGGGPRGETPDLVLTADTGSEKPATYHYLDIIRRWMEAPRDRIPDLPLSAPAVQALATLHDADRERPHENATLAIDLTRSTLMQSQMEDRAPRTSTSPDGHQPSRPWNRGLKVVRLIGYDASPADTRRHAHALTIPSERFRVPISSERMGLDPAKN